ncbi:extensin family protein [Bosea sp. BE125]|uniref:extensin-like domain-containing protein n=1 Tax=Bosea sp. BE125 TaxID=2817909 RepID=UPI00286AD3B6|nr:extensin family protein [Bosea sp. BE125]
MPTFSRNALWLRSLGRLALAAAAVAIWAGGVHGAEVHAPELHAAESISQSGAGIRALPPPRPVDLRPQQQSLPSSKPADPSALPAGASPADPPNPEGGAACLAGLRALYGTRVRSADADAAKSEDAACRVESPVLVEALAMGAVPVVFEPPATLSCEMATKAAEFLSVSVQPLAKGYFGRDLVGLRVGGGHECRRRNRAATGPLSEHATGRALDIFAFVFAGQAGGLKLSVERPEDTVQQRFLLAVRQAACGAFTTSIGPGADAAHANHLHLDIQARRSQSTRFCQ